MSFHILFIRLLGLVAPVMMVACSRSSELPQPQTPVTPTTPTTSTTATPTTPVSLSVAVQGHLKQVVFTQRNTFFSDFTYDSQGRQASVWAYNQRGGEGKADNPQTMLLYDAQGRLQQIEERMFSTDPGSNTVASSSVIRRYELTYNGTTITMKSTLARSSDYGRSDYVYEIDKAGHIVKQTQRAPDGSGSETTFLFEGENMVQQETVITDAGGKVTVRQRDKYEYDTSANPLRGLVSQGGVISVQSYASKNNPVKWINQNLSPADASIVLSTSEITYQYTFSGNGLPSGYRYGSTGVSFIYDL